MFGFHVEKGQHTQKIRPLEVSAAQGAGRAARIMVEGMAMQVFGAREAFGAARMGAGE